MIIIESATLPNNSNYYDDYLEGFWSFNVVFMATCSRYDFHYVFQVSNVQSSNIAELMVNPATSECIVEYKSGGTYSYTNVDRVAIDDLLYARKDLSLGQWVNNNLAKVPGVIADNLDAVVRNIQREPIAA